MIHIATPVPERPERDDIRLDPRDLTRNLAYLHWAAPSRVYTARMDVFRDLAHTLRFAAKIASLN